MTIRDQVIDSFKPLQRFAFSHEIPFRYSNFIDGMAWVGMLAGAAHKAGDTTVERLAAGYLRTLVTVGEDARNFANEQVDDDWLESNFYPGFWYKEKPQSFAGPSAYLWAHDQGVDINPRKAPNVRLQATLYCWLAPVYGVLVNHVSALKQHMNSVMFAHFLNDTTPPDNLRFAIKDNPLYAYLYGESCEYTYSQHTGPWPAKNVWGAKEKHTLYTPVCQLTADYLQSTLK